MKPRWKLVYLAAVLALAAAYDFFGRVYVGRDASLRTVDTQEFAPLSVRPDGKAIRDQLLSWLPALAGSAGLVVDDTDPASWQFWLVGTVHNNGELFALITVQPHGGGASELLRVAEGEEIHGAIVEKIGVTEVTIRQGAEQRQLRIFKRDDSRRRPSLPSTPVSASAPALPANLPAGFVQSPQLPFDASSTSRSPKASAAGPRSPASMATSPVVKPAPNQSMAPMQAPPGGTVAEPAARGKVSQPQELKPGEDIKLPWDLPVVEGDTAQSQKKR